MACCQGQYAGAPSCSGHGPHTTRPGASDTRATNSSTTLVFPIPASPATVTSRPRPAAASASSAARSRSSSSRPTNALPPGSWGIMPEPAPSSMFAICHRQCARDGIQWPRPDVAWLIGDLLELGDVAAVDRELESLARTAHEVRMPLYLWLVTTLRASRALLDGRFAEGAARARGARDPPRERADVVRRAGL